MNNWTLAKTPLIIGHRGASADLPENTLAAFALAAEQGADSIELDVQFSANNPHYSMVDETYMAWAKKRGYRVHDWTVDDTQEAIRIASWGIHGIITSKPQFVRQHLN